MNEAIYYDDVTLFTKSEQVEHIIKEKFICSLAINLLEKK